MKFFLEDEAGAKVKGKENFILHSQNAKSLKHFNIINIL